MTESEAERADGAEEKIPGAALHSSSGYISSVPPKVEPPSPPPPLPPISPFRVALPQVLASTAKNLLLLDLGMTIAFSTIVIPALREGEDPEGLSFTEQEASWFGSVLFLCQPIGSVLSGFILEPLGRKYAMMVVNLPHLFGWFLLYSATSQLALFSAAIIMGLGIGFMEAPIITYVGEISQPKLRGTLTSYANLFATFGMVYIYVLGTLVPWRTAAAISICIPVITIIAISQVPETPVWLMSRGRHKEAENALCWLRGWVSPEYIKQEYDELYRYAESTKLKKLKKGVVNPAFIADDGTAVQPSEKDFEDLTISEKFKDFIRPNMLKPLGLIIGYFFFANFTGVTATRPYQVLISRDFGMPLDPYRATVVFGAVGFLASVLCMLTVAKFKKRPIALTSLIVAAISSSILFLFSHPWIMFFSYATLTFSSNYGASGLVWALVSEVFPFRGRSVASGLSAASSYLVSFAATKSFHHLKELLGLHGVFFVYSIITLIGYIFLHFLMPETEGRALEDIERDYAKKDKPAKAEKTDNVV